MLKISIGFALLTLALISIASAGSGLDFEEGEWEITVAFGEREMPMAMPPNTYSQCLKRSDPVPKNEKPNQVCTQKDIQIKGNTVTWSVTCANRGGEMTGKGDITYEKNKMNGSMTMKGQGITMKSLFNGRRIGKCKSP